MSNELKIKLLKLVQFASLIVLAAAIFQLVLITIADINTGAQVGMPGPGWGLVIGFLFNLPVIVISSIFYWVAKNASKKLSAKR